MSYFESTDENQRNQVQFKTASPNPINISFLQLLKYSELIREECQINDIIYRVSYDLQSLQKKYKIENENFFFFFFSHYGRRKC